MLEYGEKIPETSYALTRFDFLEAVGAENINVAECNMALEKVWIRGDYGFKSQPLDCVPNNCLKELYLILTMQSQATLDSCRNLEVFATSPFVCKPTIVSGPRFATEIGNPVNGVYQTTGPTAKWPVTIGGGWPLDPMEISSLNALDIRNCNKLRSISL